MIPAVAIPTVIAEGLLYFRRALTLIRMGNKVESLANTIDSLTVDDLRHHRSVVGEDAFFLMLGRETIIKLRRDLGLEPYTERTIVIVVSKAMVNPVVLTASVDVNTSVVAFGYALGRELQQHDEETYDQINKLMVRMNSGFVVSDPVFSYLSDIETIPHSLSSVLTDLGISLPELTQVHKEFKNGIRLHQWESALAKVIGAGGAIHKLSTFLGYVLMGAKSVKNDQRTYVDITSGPDGFALNTGFLPQMRSLPYVREDIVDIRGITKEMVDSASRRSMLNRGYILDGTSKEWIKLENSRVDTDNDTKETSFASAIQNTAENILTQRLEHKTTVLQRAANIKRIRLKGGSDD